MKKTNANFALDLRLPTAIVGLGLTGRSVHRLLLKMGIPEDQIFLFDAKDSTAQFQEPTELLKMNPKSLIVSPGVPLALSWIQDFRNHGGQLTSELSLATSLLDTEKVVGITGSIGKSTCAALLQAGLAKFSQQSFVGGNLGYPLADYVFGKLQGRPTAEWVILELSSYQLENYVNLKCVGSLITYLTANHMERYPSLAAYYSSKWFLAERTIGPVILNTKGGDLKTFVEASPQALQHPNLHWVLPESQEFADVAFAKAQLVGEHNRDNLSLVIKLARLLGWPEAALLGFLEFKGLPHRLENLGLHSEVQWINDSKATTIESVLQAVRSTFTLTKGTMHLLVGGKDKNLPWQELKNLQTLPGTRQFYFFGEVGERARLETGFSGSSHAKMDGALSEASKKARAGDLVILSPGGTSLDEFKSFEDRGNFLKNWLKKNQP